MIAIIKMDAKIEVDVCCQKHTHKPKTRQAARQAHIRK
jgi:hypothetical protein